MYFNIFSILFCSRACNTALIRYCKEFVDDLNVVEILFNEIPFENTSIHIHQTLRARFIYFQYWFSLIRLTD